MTALYAGFVSSQWTSYHNFEGRCLDCHLSMPKKGENPGTFIKDISFMCKSCHKEEDLSHPVDLKPSMKVPANLPLDWKGDITCITCHPVHQKGFGEARLRSKVGGQGFCIQCHSNLENELHKVSLGTAHASSTTGAKYIPGEAGVSLDELSIKCMSCHDATFAKDSIVEDFSSRLLHETTYELGVSHPIGVSYIEAKRKYKGAYRRVDELPRQIKLFGGIVGCGTCHNPYSKKHNALVMSNEGSALCLACHVK